MQLVSTISPGLPRLSPIPWLPLKVQLNSENAPAVSMPPPMVAALRLKP